MAQILTDQVRAHAERQPDQPALISGKHALSYAQLWRGSMAVRHWLTQNRGIGPGDRVVMSAGSQGAWFAATYLGTHLAGATAVPLDDRLGETTRRAILDAVAPALNLSGEHQGELTSLLTAATSGPVVVDQQQVALQSSDTADIMFTSGSTGNPKGVVLSHGNIMAAATNINAFIGNNASDREVLTLPLSHSFGLGRLRCNLLAGGTTILVPGLTFPALTLKALADYQATGLAFVPAGAALMLRFGDKFAAAACHVRYVEIGSAQMDLHVKRELMRVLPRTRICMHYGLTEASRSAFIEFHADREHLASVGKPTPNVEIRIVDGGGRALPAGSAGDIQVRGGTVMKEYWKNPELTHAVRDADGWLRTSDLGYFDECGYLHYKGRSDDLINVGGRKVYPLAVENCAVEIAGVEECACVAAADPEGMLGEVPVLYVVPAAGSTLTESSLLSRLRTLMAPYAVPRSIHFVEKLPKTDSGKIRRAALRKLDSCS
jgi:long-chain acyl-CoA synthetase